MSKKLLLIINPHSGRGVSKTKTGDIVERFGQHDYIVTVLFTRKSGMAEFAREHAGEYDLIVCAGGDGTLSDIIAGLVTLDGPPPVGYIPTGTTNDIATTLALPRDIPSAVKVIAEEGEPIALDVGCMSHTPEQEGEFFTYIAAFGAFTAVPYLTPQSAKRTWGHLAYVFGGIADIAAIKPRRATVEYDGETLEDEFIFGCAVNSLSIAGIVKLDPSYVDLSDGKFEVILVKNPMNIAQFGEIVFDVSAGRFDSETVRLLHASRVKFTFGEPVKWTRDGEDGGEHREVEITNRARAVRVIVPRKIDGGAPDA